jgi:energy-coupling factor transporter ATP-binding protein EcfA2
MKGRPIRLPAPYLKRVWLDKSRVPDATAYPFCLPFLNNGFELDFEHAITVIVGENGTGKSTLLEGIAALAGYDEAGGGKGYRPVDHSRAIEAMGRSLAQALRASWLPKITNGWFFRAESFFSVARYLDMAALDVGGEAPDFLSHSHGEGFSVSSMSAASVRAYSSLTSLNLRCRHRGRSSSSSCFGAWTNPGFVRSSWPRTRPCSWPIRQRNCCGFPNTGSSRSASAKRSTTPYAGVLRRPGNIHRHGFERLSIGCYARHACT